MEQTIGDLEVGTIEDTREMLEPKKVKIVNWIKKPVEKAHGEKIEFEVEHPDREETIRISAVSFLRDKQVITSGTWFNTDKEGKIQKGSALSVLLKKSGAKTLNELQGKDIETEQDSKGFLIFKAY